MIIGIEPQSDSSHPTSYPPITIIINAGTTAIPSPTRSHGDKSVVTTPVRTNNLRY